MPTHRLRAAIKPNFHLDLKLHKTVLIQHNLGIKSKAQLDHSYKKLTCWFGLPFSLYWKLKESEWTKMH